MLNRLLGRRSPMSDSGSDEFVLGFMVRGSNVTPITNKSVHGVGGRKAVTGLYGTGIQGAIRARKELLASDLELALAYASNATAYRCVDLRSQKVASMPWRVVSKRGREQEDDHPLAQALHASNALNRKSLFYMWQSAKCVHGEAYMMKVMDTFGRPFALQWLNPTAVEPFVNYGRIEYYEYYDDEYTSHERIPGWKMVYDYYHNPLDDLRGLSPMQVALQNINISNGVQNYQKSFFENDATPGGIITTKQGMVLNKVDTDRFIKWYQDQMQGSKNRFKPIMLPAPLEWQNVQQLPAPEHTEIDRNETRKICSAFGVPVSMVDYDDQRYQYSGEHDKGFYENTIIPECEMMLEVINNEILPFFDESDEYVFEWDYDKVRALVDDQVKRTTAINARMMAGNLTINEARQRFGDRPVDGGDVFFVPKAIQAVAMDDLPSLTELVQGLPENQGGDPENVPMEAMPSNNGTTGTNPQDQAVTELRAWRQKAKRKGVKAARKFVCRDIPPRIADTVRGQLFSLPDDADNASVSAVFDAAMRDIKALIDSEMIAGLADRIREAGIEKLLEVANG